MPSLADVVQQLGPTILYDERTRRFHDMAQNYRMVSTSGVIAGTPARADNRGISGYVTQDAFNAFQAEIYLYIGKVAFFTREALVEMQRTMAGEQEDTESLRNDEQKSAEERRERRRELVRGALTNISSGTRQATGMGPLGALFTGLFATLVGVLANTDIERIRETFNSIGEVFDNIREFFNKLQEYSNIILAIGAALAAMVVANMLDRTKPRTPKPSAPSRPAPTPGSGAGAGSGAKPAIGAGTGAGAAAAAGAGAAGRPATAVPPSSAPIAETGRPTTPPAPSGAPTSAPPSTSGQPTQDRPSGSRLNRAARFLAVPGISAVIEAFNAGRQIESLSREEMSEDEYKREVIRILAGAAGAIVGGAGLGILGSLLGPIGATLGAVAGAAGGARVGEWLATTNAGQRIGEAIYENIFAERPTGAPIVTLANSIEELEAINRRDAEIADPYGMLTESGVSPTQPRAPRPISEAEVADPSGILAESSLGTRREGSGRTIVLPTIYQRVESPNTRQNQPAPSPGTPSGIQTRNSDTTLLNAGDGAGFMSAAF